ncbi:hypothetical protein LC612_30875 [Nostoc sp. CHAB 5834]|nr:hypothetical protein [Nostoc sp. CHAB 5834]
MVLSVATERLDTALLQPDKNVRLACEELPATFEYRGVIPPAALQLLR